MAKFLNQDVVVSVNGVDLSDHAFSVDLPQSREQVEVSGFNSTGAREFLPGPTDETVTIGFRQDYASNSVHQTLSPLYTNRSTFLLAIRHTSASVSATNPQFTGTAALFEYNGLSGELGAASDITAVFKSASNIAPLAWATS